MVWVEYLVSGLRGCGPASGVVSLVNSGCSLLRIVDQFKLSLKFNSGAIGRIYRVGGISYRAFLMIIGFVTRKFSHVSNDTSSVSVPTLISCLERTRVCFLSCYLPTVQEGLVRTVSYSRSSISFLVLGFFSKCVQRMHGRVRCRRGAIFGCMSALVRNGTPGGCRVDAFSGRRSRMKRHLARLGGVVVGCYPTGTGAGILGTTLFSVCTYRRKLRSRYGMRSCLFIPTVLGLREEVQRGRGW